MSRLALSAASSMRNSCGTSSSIVGFSTGLTFVSVGGSTAAAQSARDRRRRRVEREGARLVGDRYGRCGLLHRRRHGFGTGRTRRRRHLRPFQNLRGEVARPARMIPALQRFGHVGFVEDDIVVARIEHVVERIDVIVAVGTQIHDDDARAGILQRVSVDVRCGGFVHDRRAEFFQRVAKLVAVLRGGIQQRDAHVVAVCDFRHGTTSTFPAHFATDRLPDKACRGNARHRFQARADDASRRYATLS